ncbi:hypothetical protein QL285_081458 [Trifolium repens]|nr:hypothetical protein QL285_081458 [Trifolium repens]
MHNGYFSTLNDYNKCSNYKGSSTTINSMVGCTRSVRVQATNHQTFVFANKSQNSSFSTHTQAFYSHLYFWYIECFYLLLKQTFEFLQANILRDHFSTQLTFKWLYPCLFFFTHTPNLSRNIGSLLF